MAAIHAAHVERSLIHGLRRVPILRSPAYSSSSLTPPSFEVTDIQLNAATSSGQAGSAADLYDAEDAGAMEGSSVAEAVGANLILGATYGFLGRLIRPRMNQVVRRAGPYAGAIQCIGNFGTLSVAYGMATLCREGAKKLGGVFVNIPILGQAGFVGSALQFTLGTLIGERLGKVLEPEAACAAQGAGPVYVSNMCLMCNSSFVVGSGQQVAALSCGHACMCNSSPGGSALACIHQYLDCRSDCPLCRAEPVQVLHELRI